MPGGGEERIARNEATFREINEAIQEGRETRTGSIGFLCECGVLGCNEVVELTIREYEAVRAFARRFLIIPGHETMVDRVIQRHAHYAVVVKHGLAGTLAARSDPRMEACW
jgi:hypothetical protein